MRNLLRNSLVLSFAVREIFRIFQHLFYFSCYSIAMRLMYTHKKNDKQKPSFDAHENAHEPVKGGKKWKWPGEKYVRLLS